jgi:hypothetical protein
MTDNRDSHDLGFRWKVRKSGDIDVLHNDRLACTLRGKSASQFLARAERSSEYDAQQLMARVTGNYKRGNERVAGRHPRNPD